MTRDDVRFLVSKIIDADCPPDSEAIDMTSLQQLEFAFAIEEDLGFRHDIPEAVAWTCVDDVVEWLKQKGELTE